MQSFLYFTNIEFPVCSTLDYGKTLEKFYIKEIIRIEINKFAQI